MVGDAAVGKTSLLISYTTDAFPGEYVPPRYENYYANVMVDGKPFNLRLWDTRGPDDYDRMRPLDYAGSDVILVTFSIVDRRSFERVRYKWVPEIKHHLPHTPFLLVGTKSDHRYSSGKGDPVAIAEGKKLAKLTGAHSYRECSALSSEGINSVFADAIRGAHASQYPPQRSHGIRIALLSHKGEYLARTSDGLGVSLTRSPETSWTIESVGAGRIQLRSCRGDCLHRPDSARGVTTWHTGHGNHWILREVRNGIVWIKSWKDDYLHRPAGGKNVTTWSTGKGNDWLTMAVR